MSEKDFFLTLSYFDNIFGPRIFHSIPAKLSNDMKEEILKYMNIDVHEGLIVGISSTPKNRIKIINFNFEIPSKWARGGKDMLMVSIICEKNYRSAMFQDKIYKFQDRLHEIPDIYKAFYQQRDELSKNPGIPEAVSKLKETVSDYYKEVEKIIENPNMGIFLTLGLSKAGKSTILHYLKNNAFKNMKPTLALKVIKILFDNKIFRTADVSGQKRLRNQWWRYTTNPDAIIFVIDINDPPERLSEAEHEFSKIKERIFNEVNDISKMIPVLICLNKVDLIDDVKQEQNKILKLLDLKNSNLNYKVQPTSAKAGVGITEGFKWIFQELLKIE